jgi:hypothetical protein
LQPDAEPVGDAVCVCDALADAVAVSIAVTHRNLYAILYGLVVADAESQWHRKQQPDDLTDSVVFGNALAISNAELNGDGDHDSFDHRLADRVAVSFANSEHVSDGVLDALADAKHLANGSCFV